MVLRRYTRQTGTKYNKLLHLCLTTYSLCCYKQKNKEQFVERKIQMLCTISWHTHKILQRQLMRACSSLVYFCDFTYFSPWMMLMCCGGGWTIFLFIFFLDKLNLFSTSCFFLEYLNKKYTFLTVNLGLITYNIWTFDWLKNLKQISSPKSPQNEKSSPKIFFVKSVRLFEKKVPKKSLK